MNNSEKLSLFRKGNSRSVGLTDMPLNNVMRVEINSALGLSLSKLQLQQISSTVLTFPVPSGEIHLCRKQYSWKTKDGSVHYGYTFHYPPCNGTDEEDIYIK